MELKYIGSDIGINRLKKARKVNLLYIISFILVTIIYIIINMRTEEIEGVSPFLIIYYIVCLFIGLIMIKHNKLIAVETLTQEICLDGFINIQTYYAKKYNNFKSRLYNIPLVNLVNGYLKKGEIEQANEIINLLEEKSLNNTGKAVLIKHKAEIAFITNNEKEFYEQYKKFEEISKHIPRKTRSQIYTSLNVQKYIIENNENETNKICDQLIRDKVLLNKIMGHYYKGVMLEKCNNEEYKEHYKYVVENGNDLKVAQIASEKIGIAQQIKYKRKKHIVFRCFVGLLFVALIFFTLCSFFIKNPKLNNTAILYVDNEKIDLPCTISEFEEIMNIEIDGEDGYYYYIPKVWRSVY